MVFENSKKVSASSIYKHQRNKGLQHKAINEGSLQTLRIIYKLGETLPGYFKYNEQTKMLKSQNFHFRLHMEVSDFYKYMLPSKEEETMRQNVVDRISGLILSIWPSAKVLLFFICSIIWIHYFAEK